MDEHHEDVVERGVYYDHQTATDGHTTARGRVYGVHPLRYTDCERYGCKAVLVLDPDDGEQMGRLKSALRFHGIRSTEDAIRAMITPPKPPKIAEPMTLGTQVASPNLPPFVRCSRWGDSELPWVDSISGSRYAWADIPDDVRLVPAGDA